MIVKYEKKNFQSKIDKYIKNYRHLQILTQPVKIDLIVKTLIKNNINKKLNK